MMMEQLINHIFENFNFAYIITVNILTYIIVSLLERFNGDKAVSTFNKRVCLVIATIICFLTYYYCNAANTIVLVNSSVAAPVFWSWVLRPIFIKCGFSYKTIDKCLK